VAKNQTDENQLTLFDIPVEKQSDLPSETKKEEESENTSKSDRELAELHAERNRRTEEINKIAKDEGLSFYDIIWHDNVQIMASIDKRKCLRLQKVFLEADDETLRSLFRHILRKRRRGDDERINRFLSERSLRKDRNTLSTNHLKYCYGPVGNHHNLDEILNEVMRKYTCQTDGVLIAWRSASGGYRSITWGTYKRLDDCGLIRINSLLDRSYVPKYVVEAVVYHELVHHLVPTTKQNNKRVIHGARFKEMLARNPNIEKADRWTKQYFEKLRNSARKQRKLF